MNYLCIAAAVVATLFCWLGPAVGQDAALTLDQALARARERAPSILSAKARIEEARGRLAGASVLLRENPQIETPPGTDACRKLALGSRLQMWNLASVKLLS